MRGIGLLVLLFAWAVQCETVIVTTTIELIHLVSTPGLPQMTITISTSHLFATVMLPNPISVSTGSMRPFVIPSKSSPIPRPSSSSKSSKPHPSMPSVTCSIIAPPSPTSLSKPNLPATSLSTAASRSTPALGIDPPAATDYPATGLFYHNKHRLNHSVPLMTWNTAQASIAAQIAASCVFAHNMSVNGGGYGQNLAAYGGTSSRVSKPSTSFLANAIVNQWYYKEVNAFLPSYFGQKTPDMSNFASWGHFSQVVWAGSSSVGCASQLCPAGTIFSSYQSWFTVCNYVAAGNLLGSFANNVYPSTGQASVVVTV